MTSRAVCWTLVLAFSAALGHLAFGVLGPATGGEYVVENDGPALGARNPESRKVHLRRKFFLNARPRHAWLKVVGRDQIEVFVNGRFVGGASERGFGAAVVADITRQLRTGPNVIAVSASQKSVSLPPLAAVEAGWVIGGKTGRIGPDDLWRCRERVERRAGWWFEADFDDRHWEPARLTDCVLKGRVDHPPASVTSPGIGKWVTTDDFDDPVSCVRREFELGRHWRIDGRPRRAWLRLAINAHYRLAINGVVIDVQENGLGVDRAVTPVLRAYDITELVTTGKNVVALLVTRASERPQLLADLEVQDHRANVVAIGSDRQWTSRPGIGDDWLSVETETPEEWQSCSEVGGLPLVAWKIHRKAVDVVLPVETTFSRVCVQIGLMAVIAVLTFLACGWAGRVLSGAVESQKCGMRSAECEVRVPNSLWLWTLDSGPSTSTVHLCLLPSTLLIAVAVLMTYDPRIESAAVYRGVWLFLAVAFVFLQWGLLAIMVSWKRSNDQASMTKSAARGLAEPWRIRLSRKRQPNLERLSPVILLLGCLVLVGFCLRMSGIADDPLHPDETTMYRAVQGLYECGFPRVHIHENLPPSYVATSEAVYYGPALADLFFDDPRYVIRVPAVCFGTATILLIFFVGRRLFGTAGGLVAAAIYTFAPIPISTTNFGRYFSQLQFFTLLTVYFYHRTIAGPSRVRNAECGVRRNSDAARGRHGEGAKGRGTRIVDSFAPSPRPRVPASESSGSGLSTLDSGPSTLSSRDLWLTTASFIATYLSWEGVAAIVPGMILACLFQRRKQLRTVFCSRPVWVAAFVVLLVVVLQHSHRDLHQASTLWFGTGARDIALTPMWRYPQFDVLYYVWAGSWQHSALLPVLGLLGAGLFALEHPRRRSVWYLSLILYVNCALFSLVLPVRAVRYAYHLVPLVVLLNSAFLVWSAERLYRLAVEQAVPHAWKRYAQGLIAASTVVVVVAAGGLMIRSEELTSFQVDGPVPGELRVADQQATTRYLLEHLQEGDVVLAISPHVVEHEWKLAAAMETAANGAVNYWIESRMQLQPALDDVRTETLHRLSGTNMISTVEELENVFARSRRIWYLTSPGFHGKLNTARVSSFLRQHMDIVYEDYQSVLMFRDAHHRPASIRVRDEDALGEARARILP